MACRQRLGMAWHTKTTCARSCRAGRPAGAPQPTQAGWLQRKLVSSLLPCRAVSRDVLEGGCGLQRKPGGPPPIIDSGRPMVLPMPPPPLRPELFRLTRSNARLHCKSWGRMAMRHVS